MRPDAEKSLESARVIRPVDTGIGIFSLFERMELVWMNGVAEDFGKLRIGGSIRDPLPSLPLGEPEDAVKPICRNRRVDRIVRPKKDSFGKPSLFDKRADLRPSPANRDIERLQNLKIAGDKSGVGGFERVE